MKSKKEKTHLSDDLLSSYTSLANLHNWYFEVWMCLMKSYATAAEIDKFKEPFEQMHLSAGHHIHIHIL